MPPQVDIAVIRNFATALLIGALLGIERERTSMSEWISRSADCAPSSCSP